MSEPIPFFRRPAITIPVVVFLAAKAISLFIAWLGNCQAGFGADCWVRWDSGLYLEIARHGHTLLPCANPQAQGYWCGTAGWAPLFPLLMRVLHEISGLSLFQSGAIVVNLCFLVFLFVTARLAAIGNYHWRNWAIMCLIAFCPGNIYFHAFFPMSLAAMLLAIMLLKLNKGQLWQAGIAAALFSMSYSGAFVLIAALGCWWIGMAVQSLKSGLEILVRVLFPACLGLILVLIYDHLATGHWNAMFLIQTKYGHGLNSPLKILGIRWNHLLQQPFGLASWIEIQTILVFLLSLIYLYFGFRNRRSRFPQADWWLVFFFSLLPFSISPQVSMYRNSVLPSTGIYSLKTAPAWLLLLLVGLFVAISVPLGILFIHNTLV